MHKIVTDALYKVLIGILDGLTVLPPRLAYRLGERLGDLVYAGLASRRRVTLENLALTLGDHQSPHERQVLAREVFRNMGRHLVDFAQLHHINAARVQQMMVNWERFADLDALAARGQGVLVISAHFGSWELLPSLALLLQTPINVIVRPPDHPVVQRLSETYRQRCGYHSIIKRQQALRESLRALHRGEIVGVLMDQSSVHNESVQVKFMGIKTFTPMGPALLALRAKCPVVGVFLVREAPGRHRIVMTDEIPIHRTGHARRDLEENSRRFNRVIEAQIRRHPDQWFWLHRRWKKRD
ncbi:lysophospholipid acyltransferase family protein [Candidatus Entotheonella palauensis]|uniref:lysophospholipid acyltransferase family protein n=1 Tax=Candidatus Entotheonella palauensis TaxID=93172 RepID=UPI000B7D127E|nr:lysophospholipid acyltransferase family protein [Candidatus Entotheonella palauensis]